MKSKRERSRRKPRSLTGMSTDSIYLKRTSIFRIKTTNLTINWISKRRMRVMRSKVRMRQMEMSSKER